MFGTGDRTIKKQNKTKQKSVNSWLNIVFLSIQFLIKDCMDQGFIQFLFLS